jgi:hypothetical protein
MSISQAVVSLPLVSLLERAIDALARTDAASLTQVLTDCDRVALPSSKEEFSRALTQQAALEKILEQTSRNLRVLHREEDFRYGRRRPKS